MFEKPRAVDRALPLGPATVHVWRVSAQSPVPELEVILSRDELTRANRFRLQQHRTEFITARASLRRLIGAYLGESPTRVRFRYGERGKPSLAFPAGALRFNVSHSAGLAAIALCADREIGIDVEEIRRLPDFESLALKSLSPKENKRLRSLPAPDRQRAFFDYWTSKEACIKVLGGGLSMSLHSFSVIAEAGKPPWAVESDDGGEGLFVRPLWLSDSHAGALAAAGADWSVSVFDLL